MATKTSIRFFDNREVRAVWNEEKNAWYFSVLDIIGAIRKEDSYEKCRNYWKYLKAKLKKESSQLVSATTQLKLTAADGKKYRTDALDADGVLLLAAQFPGRVAAEFTAWFTRSDDTIDAKSKQKAYQLFESSLIDSIEVGTTKGLQQIHAYLFGGLCDYARRIRKLNISKGGFPFAEVYFLDEALKTIDAMPEDSLEQIVKKYVEMNIAHPFLEGNGRSARIWLDMMLKERLGLCVEWSKIDKFEYLEAIRKSPTDASWIQDLIAGALTDQVNDREMFMKGIDYSYYYEEN